MNIHLVAQGVRKEIRLLERGGHDVVLHAWRPARPKAAIFYFHGLQSHAGWVWEAASQFASNGVAFFVLDRKGSGMSGGRKDDLQSAPELLSDYREAIALSRTTIPGDVPLCLFGHCLGGSVLAALLHDPAFKEAYDSSIFCSAWLGKLHGTLAQSERAALAAETSEDLWDVQLHAQDFTDDQRYRGYIESDDLAVRFLTKRSRSVLLELENMYVGGPRAVSRPAVFVSGTSDQVINLKEARRGFGNLTNGEGGFAEFPVNKHYLFFTGARTQLVNWASGYALSRGFDHYA